MGSSYPSSLLGGGGGGGGAGTAGAGGTGGGGGGGVNPPGSWWCWMALVDWPLVKQDRAGTNSGPGSYGKGGAGGANTGQALVVEWQLVLVEVEHGGSGILLSHILFDK